MPEVFEQPGKPFYYALQHIRTGNFYIGSTARLSYRYKKHIRELEAGTHHCKKLQDVYQKGDVLELVYWPCETREQAYQHEDRLLCENEHDPRLLNTKKRAGILTEELTRQLALNMSVAMKALPQEAKDQRLQNLQKYQPRAQHWIGRKHRPETIEKIRQEHRENDQILASLAKAREVRARAVIVDGKRFETIKEAADTFGLGTNTVRNRCMSNNFPNTFYADGRDQKAKPIDMTKAKP